MIYRFERLHNLHYEKFADGTVKCIEDEIPFEIPDSWAWTRLGVIFSHNTGKALNVTNNIGALKKYITTSNVYWDQFVLDTVKEMYFTDDELEKCTIVYGDLLVCEGGDIGRAAIWNKDYPICIQNHLHRLRPILTVCVKFYYYIFYLYKQNDMINGNGIGLQGLSSNRLHSLLVPLPSYKEQNRIVEKIQTYCDMVETIETEQAYISSLLQFAKSRILDLAIRGKLVPQDPNDEPASVLLERIKAEKEELIKHDIIKRVKTESTIFKGEDNSYYEKLPDGWVLVNFSTICELLSGRDLKKSEYSDAETGTPYIIGASNFYDGNIVIERWTNSPQVISFKRDILMTCKGTVGDLAFNTFGNVHIARQIMAVRNKTAILPDYLMLLMKYSINNIKQKARGLIPGISREDITNLQFPIPPLQEQERILKQTNNITNVLDTIEASLN